jgi:hypothetical protein
VALLDKPNKVLVIIGNHEGAARCGLERALKREGGLANPLSTCRHGCVPDMQGLGRNARAREKRTHVYVVYELEPPPKFGGTHHENVTARPSPTPSLEIPTLGAYLDRDDAQDI